MNKKIENQNIEIFKEMLTEIMTFISKLPKSSEHYHIKNMIKSLLNGRMKPDAIIRSVDKNKKMARMQTSRNPTERERTIQIWEHIEEVLRKYITSLKT